MKHPSHWPRALIVVLSLLVASTASAATVLRIGWQKGADFALMKARGEFAAALRSQDVSVQWFEFPAGPQMLEALNSGAIDLGEVGETPPVFAQAASGAHLLYVANQPPEPLAEAVLVPKGSPIRSVADLRGKRIALNRGSNVQYFLVKLLRQHGLHYADVHVVYLPPGDAYAAFSNGSVDAWVVWDPYVAAAQYHLGARQLADARGVVPNHAFFIGSRSFVLQHPKVIDEVLEQINRNDSWIQHHTSQAARIIAPQIAQPLLVAEQTLRHWSYGAYLLTPQVTADQQDIADTFFALKLIPRKLDVASVVWTPSR